MYVVIYIAVVLSSLFKLTIGLENSAFDFFYQSSLNKPRPDIFVIGIDDTSISELGKWPWPRSVMGELVNVLNDGAKPAVIGFDILYDTLSNPDDDEYFAEAMEKAGNVVLASQINYTTSVDSTKNAAGKLSYGIQRQFVPEYIIEPIDAFKTVSTTGFVNAIPDQQDNIIRKAVLKTEVGGASYPSFALELYRRYSDFHKLALPEPAPRLNAFNQFLINFSARPYAYYGNSKGGLSFSKVLSGEIPADFFDGAIVIIGTYAPSFGDRFFTSNSRSSLMYGTEIHANILQSLLEQKYIYEPSFVIYALLLLLVALILYAAYSRLSPAKSLLVLILFLTAVVPSCLLLFSNTGILINFTLFALMSALLYFATLAYKYILEAIEKIHITNIFKKYVAPEVVKELIKKDAAALDLGGALRDIAVLFVDVRGFTPMSEKNTPQQVVSILNEYLSLTSSCIFAYNGTLDKFIGDATMAFYNAPLPLDDYVMRAVKTALMMRDGAQPLEKKIFDACGVKVAFGIGINCGEAIVGNTGSSLRMDYTAIGDTVNTAARLESNAKPGQILISEKVYSALYGRINVTEIGAIALKGKSEKLTVYQLDGLCE